MSHPIVEFARDVLSFPLWPKQAAILDEVYEDGIRTAILRLGRRSGKGRLSAVIATIEATVNADAHLAHVPPGEKIAIVVIATSQRQARTVQRFVRGFLNAPGLAHLVVRQNAEEIELSNGITIITLPAHAAAVRGYAIPVLLLDEAAWFSGVDGGPLDVAELWRALIPSMAQFPAGRAIVMSTPRWATGWFPDMCERAERGDDPTMRAWHASTAEVNPTISPAFLAAEQAADPAGYAREYEALFVSGIGSALDADLVRAAAIRVDMLPPVAGIDYLIALDPAFSGDRFTAIVGHREPDRRIVVDRVKAWAGSKAAPVAIDPTLDEIADLARSYNGARVVTDQYSAETIRQGLVKRGVRVEAKPWTNESKVDALTAVRRCLYGSRLELPRHRELIAELVSLEQRPTPSGRPRIAAPGRGHDDHSSSLMALVVDLAAESPAAAGATVLPAPIRMLGRERPAGLGLIRRRRPSAADRMQRAREAAAAGIEDAGG